MRKRNGRGEKQRREVDGRRVKVKGIIGRDIDGQWWGCQRHLVALSSGQDTPPLRVGLAL
ncbi:hypothetical protein K0M31_000481 [Melipona bicolor]|uniref:Uncharacterized protein n=1 Tax=Melipona bicolor TaxID=60889 RepID=A0AA40GEE7_9HYME|nr:hypothetical protein K0M31_000481 [Melipona bicolor]